MVVVLGMVVDYLYRKEMKIILSFLNRFCIFNFKIFRRRKFFIVYYREVFGIGISILEGETLN